MHFGVTMFPTEYAITPTELAQELEERGFESLWFPEHTHIPADRRTPYPAGGELPEEYWHTLDPFVALSAAAAVTTRLKLATGICLLIERDTIVTAKAAASVDRISNGRFIFGVGGGWNVEEMQNHGTAFDTRFAKLEEQVAAVRAIWRDEEAQFHGKHVSFDKIWCHPKPVQQPGPPIVIGGSSKYALARAARYCDGWIPIHTGRELSGMRTSLDTLERALAEKGRSRTSFSVSIYGVAQRPEIVAQYAELGVDRLLFLIRPEPRDQVLAKLDRIAGLMAS